MHPYSSIDTTAAWKKQRLNKNAASNIEQVLEAQNNSCTATYHSSRKLSKLDEPDMQDTAGEVGRNL